MQGDASALTLSLLMLDLKEVELAQHSGISHMHSIVSNHPYHLTHPTIKYPLLVANMHSNRAGTTFCHKIGFGSSVQGDYVGFNTGNGEKPSHSKPEPSQLICCSLV